MFPKGSWVNSNPVIFDQNSSKSFKCSRLSSVTIGSINHFISYNKNLFKSTNVCTEIKFFQINNLFQDNSRGDEQILRTNPIKRGTTVDPNIRSNIFWILRNLRLQTHPALILDSKFLSFPFKSLKTFGFVWNTQLTPSE